MRRLLIFLLDALIGIGLVVLAGIALTGGGVLTVGATRLSLRSAGNGLLLVYALGALRLAIGRDTPLLGVSSFTPASLGRRAVDILAALPAVLTGPRVRRYLLIALGGGLLIRLVNAWIHPGFFSGDDVEIHEMTLGALYGWPWSVWEVRSAFYPFVFIFPIQFLFHELGISDPAILVFGGRAVVAVISSLALLFVYRIARAALGKTAAVFAVWFTATSSLLVTFGGTELPRPVAAVFVLAAFALLGGSRGLAAVAAGIAIAIAAAMRFSEALFLVPAVVQLAVERRWRALALFAAAAIVSLASLQAASDYFYWGRPFASAGAIVDFTLVQGLSSRGYQPVWQYVTHLTEWTDYLVFGLALYGISRDTWRWALWAGAPIVLLSALPHKEARYLIPVVPFVAMLAGAGLWRLAGRITQVTDSSRRELVALGLVGGLIGSFLFQATGMHVQRSDGAVQLARSLGTDSRVRPNDPLLIEQPWRLGGRIYLQRLNAIIPIEPADLQTSDDLRTGVSTGGAALVVISRESCARTACVETLGDQGFSTISVVPSELTSGYVVLKRGQ